MQEIILHHYWQSPVAEKVRVSLGILNANWRSVEIPRIPPKPDLVLLTGGYRRTPVMQIGADIYCDSLCIQLELDRRFPELGFIDKKNRLPTLGFAMWTSGDLFEHVVRVVIGHDIDSLPEEFLQDRARLYFGPNWTKESISAGVAHSVSQCESLLFWMQDALTKHGEFLSGSRAGMLDASCYYLVWFLRGRYAQGEQLLAKYAAIAEWEARVQALGYGNHSELSSSDAITVARDATPAATSGVVSASTFTQGDAVSVVPDGDGGDPVVEGKLVTLTAERIVISREDDQIGLINVHFPRPGYHVSTM